MVINLVIIQISHDIGIIVMFLGKKIQITNTFIPSPYNFYIFTTTVCLNFLMAIQPLLLHVPFPY